MEGAESSDKASWSKEMLYTFCDICIVAIKKGMKPSTHFDKAGWKFVMVVFKEKTGLVFTKTQLKNKWDGAKKEWRIWKKLISETGIGWNSELGTISASDEWWKKKTQEIRGSKKFRHAGIEPSLCSKFDRIFNNVVATGHYAWAPSSGVLFDDDVMNQNTQDVHINEEENLEEGSGDSEEDVIPNYTDDVCNLVVGVIWQIAVERENQESKVDIVDEWVDAMFGVNYDNNYDTVMNHVIDNINYHGRGTGSSGGAANNDNGGGNGGVNDDGDDSNGTDDDGDSDDDGDENEDESGSDDEGESQRPFSTVKAERRCSSNRPLASVMGALMVFDPQPATRYQPAGLYINRGNPKNRAGWRRRKNKNKQEEPRNRGHTDEDRGKGANGSEKTKGYALDLFFGGSNFSSHCCYFLRRNEQKTTGAYNKDRNREGEKLALANQHIIVFVINLQHQADIERDKENKRSKKDRRQGKQERGRLISSRTPSPPADQASQATGLDQWPGWADWAQPRPYGLS
ncbi:hypothetical protein NC653_021795 [Populus alba x Populus x berolinensis]|uniref:Myb/SANT-like domain-containing protein n=1 Tax=Populus alba x Populus x berolinensis TaxID=444605 RepID=A0AAD6MQC4_9ROSI|nr:hypothetical protein NC653_021795 [Populus alba x Populus x berolinensis]